MKKEDEWWLLCMKKRRQFKQSRKKKDILMKFSVKSRKDPKLGVRERLCCSLCVPAPAFDSTS